MRRHIHQTRLSISFFIILRGVSRGALRELYPGSSPSIARSKHPLRETSTGGLFGFVFWPVSLVFGIHSWGRLGAPTSQGRVGTLAVGSPKQRNIVCGCGPFLSARTCRCSLPISLAAPNVTDRTLLHLGNIHTSA